MERLLTLGLYSLSTAFSDIFSCFCHSVFVLFLMRRLAQSLQLIQHLWLSDAAGMASNSISNRSEGTCIIFFSFFLNWLFSWHLKVPCSSITAFPISKSRAGFFMASHVAFLMASFTIAHTPFSIHQWKKWPFLKCRWPFSSWYFFLSSYSKDIPISHFIVAHCTILSIFLLNNNLGLTAHQVLQ